MSLQGISLGDGGVPLLNIGYYPYIQVVSA